MTFDASKLFSETPLDKRPIIGAVKVNKPFTYHDNHYECAAWWEDRTAVEGVYPVRLGREYHYPKLLTLSAEISAKVTDDYFPALWGGVRISNEPYKPKHVGETRIIHQGIEVVDAVQRTGNSPGSDLDWFIHPSWWKVFTDEAEAELRDDYRRLSDFWNAWDTLKPEEFRDKMNGQWKFDDEYRSRIGMISHIGGLLEKWSRRIEKIRWHSQYHQVGGKYNTSYNQKNFIENTEWAKAIPIQIND